MVVGNSNKKVSAYVFSMLSFVAVVVLLVAGLGMWKMGSQAVADVNGAITDAKLYFPPASPEFPKIEQYAEKQLTDGDMARVYAQDFLAEQLKLMGGGKTTSEITGELMADPQNQELMALQNQMFQVETSMMLMLVGGYAPWLQGTMIKNGGMIALALAAFFLVVALVQWVRYKRA